MGGFLMKYRILGKTGFRVSEVSLGTWQLGARWGEKFGFDTAEKTVNAALDNGINFIDTADVYSDGQSEAAVARIVKNRKERVYIATKCGRRISPHSALNYSPEILAKHLEDSLKNMGLDTIDLIQLHCPPTEIYYRPEYFVMFDNLKKEGKILNLGVSVEKVEEALKAIEYPNVTTVQIIFNMFRHRPYELFFKEAWKRNVGILARVPLASGLLSGKMNKGTVFSQGDHRTFNRDGSAFDRGETFSGVDYETGLKAVGELKGIFGPGVPLAGWAIRWILMFKEVSCVIPGASKPEQVLENIMAADLRPISGNKMNSVLKVYEKYIKPSVHQLW
jgi:aryl-alcohol dehydrogenase-like predicted oxidoreductase